MFVILFFSLIMQYKPYIFFILYFFLSWQRRLCFGKVGLSVCGQYHSESYEGIRTIFYGEVLCSPMKN